MDWYRGKRVFITGGSSGIGKSLALACARSGAHVAIAARRKDILDGALEEILAARRSTDLVAKAYVLDVGDRDATRAAAADVLRDLGGLDVLVNNAAVSHVGYLKDESDENYERMMRINYLGSVWPTRAFLPHFMERRGGTIAFVSSLLGLMGIFGYSAYSASKFAITGFADCLRQDLLQYGVGVSVLFPPDTDTPQLWEENKTKPAETKAIAGAIKVMSPDDVARRFMDAMAKGRYHCIPGVESQATMFAVRHFPLVARFVIDSDLKKFWRASR